VQLRHHDHVDRVVVHRDQVALGDEPAGLGQRPPAQLEDGRVVGVVIGQPVEHAANQPWRSRRRAADARGGAGQLLLGAGQLALGARQDLVGVGGGVEGVGELAREPLGPDAGVGTRARQ
jgi:hypothetical protein